MGIRDPIEAMANCALGGQRGMFQCTVFAKHGLIIVMQGSEQAISPADFNMKSSKCHPSF
jgi:hypothetical protein